jgi:calcineurin-like phosphoesterase family protein
VTRLLAISDEVDAKLYDPDVKELEVDLVVSCGDLPFDYLEFVMSALNVPLVYVPGNHDPDLKGHQLDAETIGLTWTGPPFAKEAPGPLGGINVDGRIVDEAGLRIAGLGGSVRYSRGPNQYTQIEMRRRARRLERRARFRRLRDGRGVDVVVAHSPPAGVGDDPGDPAHRGFEAYRRLVERLSPRLLLHGHVHPFGTATPIGLLGTSEVHNVVGHKVLEA